MKQGAASLIASVLIVAFLALAPSGPAQAVEPPGFEGFDSFVDGQLSRWKVPGAVIAVIRDGEILFVKGYGLRDLERGLPMTARSAIPIGSITKPMVAISIAKLVREKRLEWDRPVREWAPEFRLANDTVTAQVTLRDMLTHRTSFNASDWGWYGAPQTREQLFAKLRHFELEGGLRERFQYSDTMAPRENFPASSPWRRNESTRAAGSCTRAPKPWRRLSPCSPLAEPFGA